MNQEFTPQNLLKSLVDKFSKSEEIFLIATFGSAVNNQMDQYSDVDLIICSNDLAKTHNEYRGIIESISKIIAISPFYRDKPNVVSEIIYLEKFRPYQKIDLTIIPYLGYLSDFNPNVFILYENQLTDRTLKKGIVYKKEATIETLDTWMTKTMDIVIGFAKSYKRQTMEIYRYWEIMKDAAIVLLFEKYIGWDPKFTRSRLAPQEYKDLFYRKLNKSEFDLLTQILPRDGKLDVRTSFLVAFFLFNELLTIKSNAIKQYINTDFINYIKTFVQEELK